MSRHFEVFPLLSIRARWIARITTFEWDHHRADGQGKGGSRAGITATRFGGVSGTRVGDVIDYEVGLGGFRSVANARLVRRQMEHTFAERQQRLAAPLAKILQDNPQQTFVLLNPDLVYTASAFREKQNS